MKTLNIFCIAILMAGLMTGCKHEQKLATYGELYKEAPTTIYIAPIQDVAPRPDQNVPHPTMNDKMLAMEMDLAGKYLYQTIATPLIQQGYYVVPSLAATQIANQETRDYRQLRNGDISDYDSLYNIDALLFVTIHKWAMEEGGVIAYLEYTLRSTKTGTDLLHCWAKGYKRTGTNFKGEPIPLKSDTDFSIDMNLSDSETLRCILLKQVSHLVLHNIPTSASKRQFKDDRYHPANPNYMYIFCNENGEVESLPITMEKFEVECFAE